MEEFFLKGTEYAYIINLDKRVLELYKGFNKKEGGAGRYADIEIDENSSDDHGEYFGIVLVGEIPLSQITEEDNAEIMKEYYEEA